MLAPVTLNNMFYEKNSYYLVERGMANYLIGNQMARLAAQGEKFFYNRMMNVNYE